MYGRSLQLVLNIQKNNNSCFTDTTIFLFWMDKCMVQASLIEGKQKFKDLNVCETLNAVFSKPLFSILRDTLLQSGCMNHFEFLSVASQLHFIWNYVRDFRSDLNFLFYEQFADDFLVKNGTLFSKVHHFYNILFLKNSVIGSIANCT